MQKNARIYPLPCFLALVGWLYMYLTADAFYIKFGLITLAAGTAVFLAWTGWARTWPFGPAMEPATVAPPLPESER